MAYYGKITPRRGGKVAILNKNDWRMSDIIIYTSTGYELFCNLIGSLLVE